MKLCDAILSCQLYNALETLILCIVLFRLHFPEAFVFALLMHVIFLLKFLFAFQNINFSRHKNPTLIRKKSRK